MKAEPFILTLGCERGAVCAKCAQTSADHIRRDRRDATWTLAQGAMSWPLCGNHAATSAHALKIYVRCFTPELSPKEAHHEHSSTPNPTTTGGTEQQ